MIQFKHTATFLTFVGLGLSATHSDWTEVNDELKSKGGLNFDHLKDHGCSCPKVFDEFSLGGALAGDKTDQACRDFRVCMSCVAKSDVCTHELRIDAQDLGSLAFEYELDVSTIGTASCGDSNSNSPCQIEKCSCYANLVNKLTNLENEGNVPSVAITGNETSCVVPVGAKKDCCAKKTDGPPPTVDWTLYDATLQTCSSDGVVADDPWLPTTNNQVGTTINPDSDWEASFDLKVGAKTNNWRSIFHVGRVHNERQPALWYNPNTLDLQFVFACGDPNNVRHMEYSELQTPTGWSTGEEHTIKIRWMKSLMKLELYDDGVLKIAFDISAPMTDCTAFNNGSNLPVYLGNPWDENVGEYRHYQMKTI